MHIYLKLNFFLYNSTLLFQAGDICLKHIKHLFQGLCIITQPKPKGFTSRISIYCAD